MQNDIYYVYAHVDPDSDEYVYIGHGNGARAYTFKTVVKPSGSYGHRNKEHSDYLESLISRGFLPHEWVYFLKRGLSKQEAASEEKELIKLFRPKFNQKPGCPLKMSIEQIQEAEKLKSQGWSYEKLSTKYGVAAMTVFRTLKNKELIYAQ